jgi:hypothetical protein
VTNARPAAADAKEPRGVAGYASPYPYLDLLQEKMEERLARKVPVKGRFCGFCYGRLRAGQETCPFCAHAIAQAGVVDEIPQDVLRAYQARQKTEARWVHLGAFFGLIIAAAFFLWQVIWAPGILGHPALAFTVLILGGYVLAQVFGPVLGGQVGYRKGSRRRDTLWAEHLCSRGDG